jgi:hypothetical protein
VYSAIHTFSTRFIIDSGASFTLQQRQEHLQDYHAVVTNIGTANGSIMTSPGEGTLKLTGEIEITSKVVPDLAHNLLSVSALCDQNNTVTFRYNKVQVVNDKTNKLILQGYRHDNLYYIDYPDPSLHALTVSSCDKTTHAHRLMGHLNYRSLRLLSKISTGLILDQDPSTICVPCAKAKSTDRNFPRSETHETLAGFKIHCDIISFEERSILGNFKYAIISNPNPNPKMTVQDFLLNIYWNERMTHFQRLFISQSAYSTILDVTLPYCEVTMIHVSSTLL